MSKVLFARDRKQSFCFSSKVCATNLEFAHENFTFRSRSSIEEKFDGVTKLRISVHDPIVPVVSRVCVKKSRNLSRAKSIGSTWKTVDNYCSIIIGRMLAVADFNVSNGITTRVPSRWTLYGSQREMERGEARIRSTRKIEISRGR